MDGSSNNSADSDHSLTWEDFFGSTTDLSPTLIGIYDSLLEPPLKTHEKNPKADAKGPPKAKRDEGKRKMPPPVTTSPSKDPRLMAGGVKLPGLAKMESPPPNTPLQPVNRESPSSKMSYVSRLKSFALRKSNNNIDAVDNIENEGSDSAKNGDKAKKCDSEQSKVLSKINSEVIAKVESNRKNWIDKAGSSSNSFDNLSPNVKRMLSSAGEENSSSKPTLIQTKKPSSNALGRSTYRSTRQSNIPLMGATSKITQSGVEIVSSADIYDKPNESQSGLTKINVRSNQSTVFSPTSSIRNSSFLATKKSSLMSRVTSEWTSEKDVSVVDSDKEQTKMEASDCGSIYDVPVANSVMIYDIPTSNKKAERVSITNQDTMVVEATNVSAIDGLNKRLVPDIESEKESVPSNAKKDSGLINVTITVRNLGENSYQTDPTVRHGQIFDQNHPSPEKLGTFDHTNLYSKEFTPKSLNFDETQSIKLDPPNIKENTKQNMHPANGSSNELNSNIDLRQNSELKITKEDENIYCNHTLKTNNEEKNCFSPSKVTADLVEPRLNLPSHLASRPLSVSSIASSSSTSSSGAQNKGGVNSAYLASIESLDDHSDADTSLVYAKSSRLQSGGASKASRDVKDEGPRYDPVGSLRPPTPRYCDPSLSQLERVCLEIQDTENVYVEDLRQVVEGYLYPWREKGTFSQEQLTELFSNIEDIYHFNKTFSQHLKECHLSPVSMARCFVRHSGGFCIYTRYCTLYPRTMATLARLAAQPTFRQRQEALGHQLPLGSYLLKPVQRILKYRLLLQNLVKHCVSHDTEYALHKMTGIAHHINDMKRRHEHAVRVQEIQSLLYGWSGQDLTTYGELCAEGTFKVFGAKAMRHAFLFDKMLLLTKNKEFGILAYKFHIMCNNLMLVESIQGQPLSFHVIPFDCPRMQVTLQARNSQHKREWTLLIKRVILENYNAVIPSHARQLVMELGQNKTDDDMLAEKSSTLISHSSMRKQLSAPEYLEKRKLERERRKSCDSNTRHRLKRSARKLQPNTETSKAEDSDYCHCNAKIKCQSCDTLNESKECSNIFCDNCNEDKISSFECDDSKRSFDNSSEFYSQSSIERLCVDCDRSIHFIDSLANSRDDVVKTCGKCSNMNYSCDALVEKSECDKCSLHKSLTQNGASKKQFDRLELPDAKNKMSESLNVKKTCLKCQGIKENIMMVDSLSCEGKKERKISKDDSQMLVVPKNTGSLRRKSEPGMSNIKFDANDWNKTLVDNECNKHRSKDNADNERCVECGKITQSCVNCGRIVSPKRSLQCDHANKNLVERKCRSLDRDDVAIAKNIQDCSKSEHLEIKMYNAKTVPKKISKIKKNRAKNMRHIGGDSTAKFYTDFNVDDVLHISESTDSISTINNHPLSPDISSPKENNPEIDEILYQSLIQKTDSFKKSEIEKDKLASNQKEPQIINCDVSSVDGKVHGLGSNGDLDEEASESCDDGHSEKPLEQIISQLLMQNREFQKILKRHQLRNATNRRHQRLLKSYSNPEKIVAQSPVKLKPKYGRQTSASEYPTQYEEEDAEPVGNERPVMEEHIYETLLNAANVENIKQERVESSVEDIKHDRVEDTAVVKKVETLELNVPSGKQTRVSLSESDYVYLCFDGKNHIDAYKIPDILDKMNFEDDGVYAVPTAKCQKVETRKTDKQETANVKNTDVKCYDDSSDVWKRISNDTVIENPKLKNKNTFNIDEYLDSNCQNPNLPQIWLNRQKEHFVPRDKKSDSLPRSFQVILNNEENLSALQSKPNVLNKVYLNKDGRVLQTDRPFTIASDHSEISYEDIERFIKGDDNSVLKFPTELTCSNRSSCSFIDSDGIGEESVSRSTLELEAEIDRCYKSNFGDLNTSSTNLLINPMDVSISSSMEVMNEKTDISQEDLSSFVHPEHKIYKPTANVLSLKGMLSKFKLRSRSNSQDNSCEKEQKKECKNVAEKTKSKSQSRNLMQRFKSIISDDQTDQTDTDVNNDETSNKNSVKSCVTVLVTNADDLPTKNVNLELSQSFCEGKLPDKTISSEFITKSCSNVNTLKESNCVGTQNIFTSVQFPVNQNIPLKSAQNSVQDLNKLPIYKQGSRHLGARIAQSDYADPRALLSESTSDVDKVNVLINKSAIRPDSLLSNSSHFTSSSDGCVNQQFELKNSFLYKDKLKINQIKSEIKNDKVKEIPVAFNNVKTLSDESYYEKSFDEIENILGSEIFRDSAIYSDPDDVFSLDNDVHKFSAKRSFNNSLKKVQPLVIVENDEISKLDERIPSIVVTSNEKIENATLNSSPSCSEQKTFSEQRNIAAVVEQKNATIEEQKIVGKVFEHKNDATVLEQKNATTIEEQRKVTPIVEQNNVATVSEPKIDICGDLKVLKIKSPITKIAPPVPMKPISKLNVKSKNIPLLNLHGKKPLTLDITLARDVDLNKNKHQPISPKSINSPVKLNEKNSIDKSNKESTLTKFNLSLNIPEKKHNLVQIPVLKSPTDRTKIGIPRPTFERTTSSNIQLKRMSFERCSLDSSMLTRRTKTQNGETKKDSMEEKIVTKSVQERRKEIEMLASNVLQQKTNSFELNKRANRKSVDSIEERTISSSSSIAFTRSVSVKLTPSKSIVKVPTQKCNIPLPNVAKLPSKDSAESSANVAENVETFTGDVSEETSETLVGDESQDNSKAGWVKHVVNRFQ